MKNFLSLSIITLFIILFVSLFIQETVAHKICDKKTILISAQDNFEVVQRKIKDRNECLYSVGILDAIRYKLGSLS